MLRGRTALARTFTLASVVWVRRGVQYVSEIDEIGNRDINIVWRNQNRSENKEGQPNGSWWETSEISVVKKGPNRNRVHLNRSNPSKTRLLSRREADRPARWKCTPGGSARYAGSGTAPAHRTAVPAWEMASHLQSLADHRHATWVGFRALPARQTARCLPLSSSHFGSNMCEGMISIGWRLSIGCGERVDWQVMGVLQKQ